MRDPDRPERDALRVTLLGAAAIAVAIAVGAIATPLVGVVVLAVLAGALVAALLLRARRERRPVLREAADAPHAHGAEPGTRHVLVVANAALAGDEVRAAIEHGDGRHLRVDVLAPVLTSRTHLAVSDVDREIAEARARLDRSLAWARGHGIEARGEVGDPSPTTAIADELRDFGADEVVVVTHPRDRETWQERGELERLRRELDVPVAHVEVGSAS